LPDVDSKRLLRVTYQDGAGVLRDVLAASTSMGFSTSIENSRRVSRDGEHLVIMDIRFHGKPPIRDLIPPFMDLPGVKRVTLKSARNYDADEDGDRI
jgi:putative Mg2+ transporter-C (MgtC) family protein